jgi:dimethylsulfone monooxygenase
MEPYANTGLYGRNKFKIGLFGMNCSNGLTMTMAPERWIASWDNNREAAILADEAGIDFLLPIGRWNGYAGKTDFQGATFETLTWACGLLASTSSVTVCGTLHVPFANPVFAAKQMVTAHHIGKGRFALNIVSGWNQGEFDMFGVELIPHDVRYTYTEEWVDVVKRIWSETEPFDHEGRWLKMKDVSGKPKPWGGRFPMLISAGASPEGRGFAARHVDCLFTSIRDASGLKSNIEGIRAMGQGREFGLFASGHVICRQTRKQAEEFYDYIVHEHGDWEAAESAAKIRLKGREGRYDEIRNFKERLISGLGTYMLFGSYDEVAEHISRLSESRLDGMALGLVNFITEIPHLRDGLFPRLERLGLREKFLT